MEKTLIEQVGKYQAKYNECVRKLNLLLDEEYEKRGIKKPTLEQIQEEIEKMRNEESRAKWDELAKANLDEKLKKWD